VSYRDTYDNLCVLLEEYADADIETVANQIFAMFGLLGEDLLDALDPPTGLQTWLRQHGLSLITTTEGRSPRVWEALKAEEEDSEVEESLEEEPSEELPLQVGEHVEYRTAPKGPRHVSDIGAGRIKEINADGSIWVSVWAAPDQYVVPAEGDLIRRRIAPESSPTQNAQVSPW
jgi:hypothetical protein